MNIEILAGDSPPELLYREHLQKGNLLRFRALGGSMWPAIRSGDILHVQADYQLKPGVVLLVERERAWFAHRLQSLIEHPLQGRLLIMRGDALPANDPPVNVSQVLGQVIAVEREQDLIKMDGLWAALYRYSVLSQTILPALIRSFGRWRGVYPPAQRRP